MCVIHYIFNFYFMNTTKKLAYATVGSALLLESAAAQINYGSDKVQSGLQGSKNTADVTIQNLIQNAMIFLAILAVCYGLYGGFLMLTAGGDDKKVSQGKTILIQVGLGLVVIFLANSIVQFILNMILKQGS